MASLSISRELSTDEALEILRKKFEGHEIEGADSRIKVIDGTFKMCTVRLRPGSGSTQIDIGNDAPFLGRIALLGGFALLLSPILLRGTPEAFLVAGLIWIFGGLAARKMISAPLAREVEKAFAE